MKRLLTLVFSFLLLLGFVGCGGGSSGSDPGSAGSISDPVVSSICNGFTYANGKILKTGQTKTVADFDDGVYKKGIDRNYVRDDENNTVVDCATGLVWQDDEESVNMTKVGFLSQSMISTTLTTLQETLQLHIAHS